MGSPHRERIRVLFVTPNLAVGGAERHLATLVPALDRTRFEPAVVCIKEPGALFASVLAAGVPAMSLDAGTVAAPLALRRLVRIMRRRRPHVVITRGFNGDVLGRVAAALCRVPVVAVWKHNADHISPRYRESLANLVLDPVTDLYLGVAHGQVAYLKDGLGFPSRKIRIIHSGVDPSAFPYRSDGRRDEGRASLGLQPGDAVVGIVAVMRPEKDHDTFLRAGRLVVDAMPAARLLLVGDGPERIRLERLAAELGLGDRVVFTGMRADAVELMGLFDVAVLSSTTECLPYVVLEAMAMGVPTVCTAVGGLPEMVEDEVTGRLVPPAAPADLAEAILSILQDPRRTAAMGAAARRRLEERFTLARAARETEACLERAVARSTRGGGPSSPNG
jgi:glycosyltransferase involved in cell wall biosynthesis